MILSYLLGTKPFIPPPARIIPSPPKPPDKRKKETPGFKSLKQGNIVRNREIKAAVIKLMSSGKEFYIVDITKAINCSHMAVRRCLNKLCESGKVTFRSTNHNRHCFKMIKGKK